MQVEEHPSPGVKLLSSHDSLDALRPSPQVEVQSKGYPFYEYPNWQTEQF